MLEIGLEDCRTARMDKKASIACCACRPQGLTKNRWTPTPCCRPTAEASIPSTHWILLATIFFTRHLGQKKYKMERTQRPTCSHPKNAIRIFAPVIVTRPANPVCETYTCIHNKAECQCKDNANQQATLSLATFRHLCSRASADSRKQLQQHFIQTAFATAGHRYY